MADLRYWATDAGYWAALPVCIIAALFSGFGTAILLSCVVVAVFAFAAHLYRSNLHTLPLGQDKDTVLAALAEGLSRPSRHHDVACVSFEITNVDQLRAVHGGPDADNTIRDLLDGFGSVLRSTDRIAQIDNATYAIALDQIRRTELDAVITLIDRLKGQITNRAFSLDICFGFCTGAQSQARTAKAVLAGACDARGAARLAGAGAVRGYSNNARHAASNPDTSHAVLPAMTVDDDRIIPYFQPQICTDTGRIVGMEALARWTDDAGHIQPPQQFLTSVAHFGRLEDLSEAMLDQSLKALKSWDRDGLKIPSISINLALQELRNPNLTDRIKWDLDRFDLAPHRLRIELPETVLAQAGDDVIARNLGLLSDYDIGIDLDKFGTGNVSLPRLARLNVDRIKIDRSLIANVDSSTDARRIICAVTALCDQLAVTTIAAGVETQRQREMLAQLGCGILQGYAIAKPMPFAATVQWLRAHNAELDKIAIFPRKVG